MTNTVSSFDAANLDFSDLNLASLDLDAVEIIEANDSVGMPAYGASCAGWVTSCSCSLCHPMREFSQDG